MATHKELKTITKARLKSARVLIDKGDYDGAVYFMGYCLECALKSVICRRLNFSNYPDRSRDGKKVNIFRTHEFDILLAFSGLEEDFNLIVSSKLAENWSTLTKWSPDIRYEPIGTYSQADAERRYSALTESPDGILTWLTRHKRW